MDLEASSSHFRADLSSGLPYGCQEWKRKGAITTSQESQLALTIFPFVSKMRLFVDSLFRADLLFLIEAA